MTVTRRCNRTFLYAKSDAWMRTRMRNTHSAELRMRSALTIGTLKTRRSKQKKNKKRKVCLVGCCGTLAALTRYSKCCEPEKPWNSPKTRDARCVEAQREREMFPGSAAEEKQDSRPVSQCSSPQPIKGNMPLHRRRQFGTWVTKSGERSEHVYSQHLRKQHEEHA